MEPKEGQFVPVAALKSNLAVADMEDSTASEPLWIAPFQDRHVGILKYILHDANHVGGCKLTGKHGFDRGAAFDRILRNLMVDRILMVEASDFAGFVRVERLDPASYQFARSLAVFRLTPSDARQRGAGGLAARSHPSRVPRSMTVARRPGCR
jgi:hypothetical protein